MRLLILAVALSFVAVSGAAETIYQNDAVKKPCPSHGGAAYYFEGSGSCTGNLMTTIPLPTAGIALIHNSLSTTFSRCLSGGWNLSSDTTFEVAGNTGVMRLASGHTVNFSATAFGGGTPGVPPLFAIDPLQSRDVIISNSPYTLRTPDGQTLKFSASVNGQKLVSVVSDRFGVKSTFTRNSAGCPTDIASHYGKHVTFSYTAGRVTAVTDAMGGTYTLSYGADGYLTRVLQPNGTYWEIVMGSPNTDGENLVKQLKAPNGLPATQYKYIPGTGVLSAVLNPYNWLTSYTYTVDTVEVATRYGKTTETFENGRIKSIAGKTGTVTYAPDAYGRPLSITDEMKRVTLLTYNAPSGSRSFRFPSTVTTPDGVQTAYTYDDNLNITKTIASKSPKSITTNYTWDSYGMMLTKEVNGKTEIYSRDRGNLAAITNSSGQNIYAATYNADGQMTSTTDQFNRTKTFTWEAGRVTQIKDHLDRVTRLIYDDSARTITKRDSSGFTNELHGFKVVTTLDSMGDVAVSESSYNNAGELHSTKVVDNKTLFAWGPLKQLVTTTFYDNRPTMVETRNFAEDGAHTMPSSHTIATLDNALTNVTIEGTVTRVGGSTYGVVTNTQPFPAIVVNP